MALICRSVLGPEVFKEWVDSTKITSYRLAFDALNRWFQAGFAVALYKPDERLHEMSPSFIRAARRSVFRVGIRFFSIGEYALRGGYTARQGIFTIFCDPLTNVLCVWNRESDPIFLTTEKDITDGLAEIGRQLKLQRKMESRVRQAILTLAEMAESKSAKLIQPIRPTPIRLTPFYQTATEPFFAIVPQVNIEQILPVPAHDVSIQPSQETFLQIEASPNYHRIPASTPEPKTMIPRSSIC